MREIYIYGYIFGNGKKEFEGYGVHSPIFEDLGFTRSAKTGKELESIVSEQLKEHPHSMLISGIPDVSYYRGDKFVINYGGKNSVYVPSDDENMIDFLKKVDFSKLKRLEVSDGHKYFIFKALAEEELPIPVRNKLHNHRILGS